jgi:outer membrane protein OmpA-like peptidoglycan-associated protein
VRLKFVSEYRYEGEQEVDGVRSGLVSARYALRYLKAQDPWARGPVVSVTGSHDLRIRLDPATGVISFMRDRIEEEYRLEDGRSIGYRGFSLTWVLPAAPLDQEETVKTIAETLRRSGGRDVEVARTQEGVTVSVNRIHFVADEATVLPEDLPRLASVAEALSRVPGRSFRVIGHTARIGTEESQHELSVRRAKAVVDYLVSRGLSADRFLYEGRGGAQPVASNETEEGRAANRRVEIVILED